MRCSTWISLFIYSMLITKCINLSEESNQPIRYKLTEVKNEFNPSISFNMGYCSTKCEFCCLPIRDMCGSKEQCVLVSFSRSLMIYVIWIVSFIFLIVALFKVITSSSLPHQQDSEKIKSDILKKYCNFYLSNQQNSLKFKAANLPANYEV